MKKIITTVLLALFVLAVPMSLVGCSNSIYGTYAFSTIKVEYAENFSGDEMSQEDLEQAIAEQKDTKISIYKDGSASIVEQKKVHIGSWKKEGNKILISFKPNTGSKEYDGVDIDEIKDIVMTCIIKGKTLTVYSEDDGMIVKLIYKK